MQYKYEKKFEKKVNKVIHKVYKNPHSKEKDFKQLVKYLYAYEWTRFSKIDEIVAKGFIALEESTRLIPLLTFQNKWVRSAAVIALGELKNPNTFTPLTISMVEADTHVRKNIVIALGKFKDQRAMPMLITSLIDSDEWVKYHAIEALATLGSPTPIKNIIECVDDSSQYVGMIAVDAIIKLSRDKTIDILLDCLKRDCHYEVKNYIAKKAASMQEDAFDILVKQLESDDKEYKRYIIMSLCEMNDKRVLIPLLNLYPNINDLIRPKVVNVISTFGDAKTVETLISILKSGRNNSIKEEVAALIGSIKQDDVYECLIQYFPYNEALHFSDFPHLIYIAIALGQLGDKRAIPVLESIPKENLGGYGDAFHLNGEINRALSLLRAL